MRLTLAVAGLAAICGTALLTTTASAMPGGLAPSPDVARSNIEQARLVCNGYGRCFRVPGYAYGYGYGPGWRGGYYGGWHRGWYGRRW